MHYRSAHTQIIGGGAGGRAQNQTVAFEGGERHPVKTHIHLNGRRGVFTQNRHFVERKVAREGLPGRQHELEHGALFHIIIAFAQAFHGINGMRNVHGGEVA